MKLFKAFFLSVMLCCASVVYAAEVNINQADAVTLSSELKGIGEKKAQAIIDYRKQNGPFKSIEELQNVKGISIKTIDKNRAKLGL